MESYHDAMATPVSTSGPAGSADNLYEKAILKGEIKVDPKLGEDNYQTWSETMELLFSARML